jgi:murein DD-endopeptidase MepM/ murein hydrolase activator NlpD
VDVIGLTSGVTAIATGISHTCALTTGGGIKCWGQSGTGAVGDGTTITRLSPVDVIGLSNGVMSISTGGWHTCALTSSGGIKCWGRNDMGELGDGTIIHRLSPVDVVGLSNGVTYISSGEAHNCALVSNGGIECWGYNNSGQLGDGSTTQRLLPVNVVGLTNGVIAFTTGYVHTCALTSSGGIKCWGYNNYGQLGDGTITTRLSPVDVIGLDGYSISGFINDDQNSPKIGVAVRLSNGMSTTTDENGYYKFSVSDQTNYTIIPSLSEFRFAPEQAIIDLTKASTHDFVIRPQYVVPFLDLPLNYPAINGFNSSENFAIALMGSSYGLPPGYVNSWFDHTTPKYGHPDGNITLWDGIPHLSLSENISVSNCLLGITCYDYHNGIDFRHTMSGDEMVFAVADVTVVNPDKIIGYGNEVLIDHHNGYATLYGHLKSKIVNPGDNVTARQMIGVMGNTGLPNMGIHLHLGVYYDNNGDHNWGESEVVDPFGWKPIDNPGKTDPWSIESQYLWIHNNTPQCTLTTAGITQKSASGMLTIQIPANDVTTDVNLDIFDTPPIAEPSASLRFTGQNFLTRILEWLSGSSLKASSEIKGMSGGSFAEPINMVVSYDPDQLSHLDLGNLVLYIWNVQSGTWEALPTTIDAVNHTVTALTTTVGNFSLQAPLLCPNSIHEINDNSDSSTTISTDNTSISDNFDIQTDEDWFNFDGLATREYVIRTNTLSTSVDTTLELYDVDGETLLATDDNNGGGNASQIEWQAPQDGRYYLRVTRSAGSSYRCDSTYEIQNELVEPNPIPTLTSINPNYSVAGKPGFTLIVNGTGFVADSVVKWNGSNRTTSFIDETQLTAQIEAADIEVKGQASITVYSPEPGGGTSSGLTLNIINQSELPASPMLSIPLSNAIFYSRTPTLTVLKATGAAKYQFQVSLSDSFEDLVLDQTTISTNYTFTKAQALVFGNTYYWHVRTINNNGYESDWSASRKFTVTIQISPVNGATVTSKRTTFKWFSASTRMGHHIQVSTDPDFTNLVLDIYPHPSRINTFSFMLPNGTYYWRMQYKITDEWSVFMPTWVLTVNRK